MAETATPTTNLRRCWHTVRAIRARHTTATLSHERPDAPRENVGEQFLPPAVKWILDHYRFIEDQIVETRGALPGRFYRVLPRRVHESRSDLPVIHEIVGGL